MRWIEIIIDVFFISLLIGCAGFPELHPHMITLKNGVCTSYPVIKTDVCNISVGPGIDLPLSACDGFYAFPPSDMTAVLEYQKQQCIVKP